ncbi:MAG: hypothetical protein PVF54_08665 [Anaerolineae bacterium]
MHSSGDVVHLHAVLQGIDPLLKQFAGPFRDADHAKYIAAPYAAA